LLPGGKGVIQAAKPAGSIDGFVGLLAGRSAKVATLQEMDQAVAAAWAGQK
jgi:hypothetical protein